MQQDNVQANSESVQYRVFELKHDNVCVCTVSALVLLPVANLSPEMHSATRFAYETQTFGM